MIGRAQRRAVERAEAKERAAFVRTLGARLEQVPPEEWPPYPPGMSPPPIEVWRSRRFVVQVYDERQRGGLERISVQRTDRGDGIGWDALQEVKAEIGRGGVPAVEFYPPEGRVVNVANMRHLWTLPVMPEWAWRSR